MIPHLIDLICRGLSLAALVWGVFSMGFSSAERRAATVRSERPDQSEVELALQPSPGLRPAGRADFAPPHQVERALRARSARGPNNSEVGSVRFHARPDHHG